MHYWELIVIKFTQKWKKNKFAQMLKTIVSNWDSWQKNRSASRNVSVKNMISHTQRRVIAWALRSLQVTEKSTYGTSILKIIFESNADTLNSTILNLTHKKNSCKNWSHNGTKFPDFCIILNIDILKGNAATQLRYGGQCLPCFVTNLILNAAVKEFWKLIKNWKCYGHG